MKPRTIRGVNDLLPDNLGTWKYLEEKVIQTDEVKILSLSGTDWSNPDNVQGTPGEFFISQEGFLCQTKLVNYWNHGIQQSGRMCRLPNGAWRVLN